MVMSQIECFELMFLAGALGGIVFDFYRAIRRTWRLKGLAEYLGDIVFCSVYGAILVYALFRVASASLRLYTLLGFALGTWSYETTLGGFVLRVFTRCFSALNRKRR